MRILPIFAQKSHINSTAMGQGFQKLNNKQSAITNSRMDNNKNDVFVRMAEASYSNSPRGIKIQSELQSMGLI